MIGARRQSNPNHGGMRAEHLAPAAGAAIACAFLALGLMLQRQMARQEQVLREILRMLLDSQLESNRLLKRRQTLTGSPAGSAAGIDSDTDPWYGDTGATLAPARTGSRVPRAAASPDNCANCRVEHRSRFGTDNGAGSRGNSLSPHSSRPPNSGSVHIGGLSSHAAASFPRSFSVPNELAQAGPRQIVATSSQTVRFSRCTSDPAGSRDLAPAAPRLASQPQTLSQEPPRLGSAAPRRVSVPTGSRDLAHVAAAGFSRCPSGSSSHSVVSQQQHQLSQSAQPRRPRSSTSSGISFCKPAARPPAAASLSQHSALACRQAAVSMSAGWGPAWQALALFVLHCSCVSWVSFGA